MLTTPLPRRADRLAEARQLHAKGRIAEAEVIYRLLVDHDAGDAEALQLLGIARHQQGASDEAVALIRRALDLDPAQQPAWQNIILPLIELGRIEEAVAAGAEALRLAPEKTGTRGNYVLALVRAGQLEQAALVAEEGIALDPGEAGFWSQLGHIRLDQGEARLGELLLRRALALDPEHLEARYNLGVALQTQRRDGEAIGAFEAVLAKDAAHKGARLNLGVALRTLGRIPEALAIWRASSVPPDEWADLAYNIACGQLLAGDWPAAWDGWERRTETIQPVEINYRGGRPRWRGEPVEDKTVVAFHEQGLGDTVQTVRFVAAAAERVGRLILVVQPQLKALLSSLEPVVAGKVQLLAEGEALPEHDFHVPLMSLPAILASDRATLPRRPYLSVAGDGAQARAQYWAKRLTDLGVGQKGGRRTLRVGLVWQGNPKAPVEKGRSVPLAALAPLGLVPGVQFVSLQKGVGAEQVPPPGLTLLKLGDDFDAGADAFLDTAAVASLLDLTITSDTSVAHVLGALGRPVWLMLKHVPDWRWGLSGVLSPLYPTMRLFRQKKPDDWAGVVEEVAGELATIAGLLAHPQPITGPEANVAFRRAIDLHDAGRHEEAAPIYRALVATRPSDGRIINVLAMAEMEAGKRSRAALKATLPLALRSVALLPLIADFFSNLAIMFKTLGEMADAKAALQHALGIETDHAPAHLTLAGIEAAEGDLDGALKRVRKVIGRSPTLASAYTTYAGLATDAGRIEEAVIALRRAVDLEPGNAKTWVQLGAALMAAKDEAGAARAWEKALVIEPDNADALGNLGVHERSHGDVGIAEWLHTQATIANPEHAEAWSNRGIAALDGGRQDEAIRCFREAVRLKPAYADAHMALGMALIGKGDWASGLAEYEWRLKSSRLGMEKALPRLPHWAGEDPRGKSFLALCEQGFGDAIQFVRYVRLLKDAGAAKVYVGCRGKLAALMAAADGVDGVVAEGSAVPKLDYFTHLMSLPLRFGTRVETIPGPKSYIEADPERVERWALHLSRRQGFRIGLIWQGNPDPQVDKGRSMALSLLEPIARIPGVRLIALQKGAGSEQIAEVADRFEVEDLGAEFDTGPDAFLDTAAVAMNLDLIISTDTAVCHLAGSLGRPVWLFLKEQPEWRWLEDRADTPWYPSMRLFRQMKGDTGASPWEGAVKRMTAEVAKLVAGDRSRLFDRTGPKERPRPPKALAPAEAFQKGLAAHQADRRDEAMRHYGQVLIAEPDHTETMHMLGAAALQDMNWARALVFLRAAKRRGLATPEFKTNLAIALRNLGRAEEAEALARQAVASAPTAEGCLTLGNILRDREAYADAEAVTGQGVKLAPNSAKLRRGHANALKDLGRLKEALAEFDRAVKLTPDDPELRLDRAHALLYAGDMEAGFKEYEWRRKGMEMVPRDFPVPRWDGQPFKAHTLLIHGEQGLGDHIQFARFVAQAVARGGHVVLEVRRPLFGLMKALGLTANRVRIVEQGLELPHYDFEVPLISLPAVLGTRKDELGAGVPYMKADPKRVEQWRERIDPKRLSVGLVWQGNPRAKADKGRSPPLAALSPLIEVPGTQFIALQKEHGLDQLTGDLAARLERPGPGFDEGADAFLDTAALMMSLDLVITSDTAAAHLAGALGRPTVLIVKAVPDWRWTHGRSDSLWYPTMHVFRQKKPGDWASAVEEVRAALTGLAQHKTGAP
jgi:tetratricopeptide (TPR) repeat protein/ADP-heptose:LPS heptosyltransferase